MFNISTNGMLTSLHSFTYGANPVAGLSQGGDGYFYGTTEVGGRDVNIRNPSGTVFRFSTNGVLTYLYAFYGDDGGNPAAGLVQASDGNFYGTTSSESQISRSGPGSGVVDSEK